MKISPKWIVPCNCVDRNYNNRPYTVHAYCATARIILNQRIFCEKCHFQYNLFIKQEQICSGKLLTLFVKYVIFMIMLTGFSASFLILDAYLKTESAQEDKESLADAQATFDKQRRVEESLWFTISHTIDYSQPFDVVKSVRWGDMVHIVIILVILMSWCFYFQFNRALATRKKLIYVEVRSKDQIVSRI